MMDQTSNSKCCVWYQNIAEEIPSSAQYCVKFGYALFLIYSVYICHAMACGVLMYWLNPQNFGTVAFILYVIIVASGPPIDYFLRFRPLFRAFSKNSDASTARRNYILFLVVSIITALLLVGDATGFTLYTPGIYGGISKILCYIKKGAECPSIGYLVAGIMYTFNGTCAAVQILAHIYLILKVYQVQKKWGAADQATPLNHND